MTERPEMEYEVITVNDNSPDQVLQVLTDYAETHSWLRVRLILQKTLVSTLL